MQTYLENKYRNSILDVNPNADVKFLSQRECEFIKSILDKLEEEISSYEGDDELTPSELDFEQLVREIRSGGSISILSPLSPLSPLSDVNDISENLSNNPNNTEFNSVSNKVPELKRIVMIVNNVNEGDPIPPLPSWIDTSHHHQDYHIKRSRLDQMIKSDYATSHTNEIPKVNTNLTWLETSESYDLDKLYNDSSVNDSSVNEETLKGNPEIEETNSTKEVKDLEREESSLSSIIDLYDRDGDVKSSEEK